MRKSSLLLALFIAAVPACAVAQIATGARDGTNNVRSDSLGTPKPSTDPMTQYMQQRALDNLPANRRASASGEKLGLPRPAKPDELVVGAVINDNSGSAMAKIDKVESDGVVVSMGNAKVKVSADAFGHDKAGLLLDMSKSQFEQIVAKANTAPAG